MPGRLQDRVAVITGGGTGIGAATARRFAAEGSRIVICGRRPEPLEAVSKEIGTSCEAHSVDVGLEPHFGDLLSDVAERYGRLDVLVNNAFAMTAGPIDTMTTEDWHASFRVTLDATFFGLRAALPIMTSQGGGSIVNVSSTAGHAGQAALAAYGAAKAALENLTRTAAIEGAPGNVRVNALAPGVISTEGTEAAFAAPAARDAIERLIPLRRFGDPDEVAAAILFLASDDASYVTGACLIVDGGQRACLGAPVLEEGFEAGSGRKSPD